MSAGILITARLGSTRLKRKHLLEVCEKPIISFLIDRIREEFKPEIEQDKVKLIIATSDEPENRDFEIFSGAAAVFYGSLNNIPLRHMQAAREHELESIVSVDGDDILCSPKGMRKVYESLSEGRRYVKTSGLPFGMNSWGYTAEFLEQSLSGHREEVLETGWGRIFEGEEPIEIKMPFPAQDDRLRFTLDYQEDYRFLKTIIKLLSGEIIKVSDEKIVETVLVDELYRMTREIAAAYWENFNRKMEEEKQIADRTET
jgi:spore coat polysaccharide biosynthesis protein SpsF